MEPSFFDLFSFTVEKGNAREALASPDNIILTQQSSQKIFGDTDPIDQSVYWQQHDTTLILNVAGIVGDTPRNSTLQFDALISMKTMEEHYRQPDAWGVYSFHTYALMKPGAQAKAINAQYHLLVQTHYKNDENHEPEVQFFNIPLSQLHLSSLSRDAGFTGNWSYLSGG